MSTPVRRAWALTLLWIAVIFAESFVGSAHNTGSVLYPVLRFFFPHMAFARMVQIHHFLRKGGHFFGYGVLSLTLYHSWWTTLAVRVAPVRRSWREMLRAWNWRAALLALAGTLAVAGLDEFHQSFDSGRTASVSDVALDELGGLLAQSWIVAGSSVALARRKRKAETRALTSS